MMRCSQCGERLEATAQFCIACGAAVNSLPASNPTTILSKTGSTIRMTGTMCPSCGLLSAADTNFCPSCGTSLNSNTRRIRPTQSSGQSFKFLPLVIGPLRGHVTIKVGGANTIEVAAQSPIARQEGDVIRVSDGLMVYNPITIHVPLGAQLTIQELDGELVVEDIEGAVFVMETGLDETQMILGKLRTLKGTFAPLHKGELIVSRVSDVIELTVGGEGSCTITDGSDGPCQNVTVSAFGNGSFLSSQAAVRSTLKAKSPSQIALEGSITTPNVELEPGAVIRVKGRF